MCVQDKEYEIRQLMVFLEMLRKGLFLFISLTPGINGVAVLTL